MSAGVTLHGLGAVTLLLALLPGHAVAHDASAWGGLFRTRDAGAAWLHVNPASFVSGAMALAVSPVDHNHLLLATDSGVSRSRNGGRDWVVEAPDLLVGSAFAAAFDVDGERALISGAGAIFSSDGERWRPVRSPAGSMPARALVSGSTRGRVYLAGWTGLYRSDDWGQSWISVGDGLPAEYATAAVMSPGWPDHVYVLAAGRPWASTDAGRSWQPRDGGLPSSPVGGLALDRSESKRLWSVAAARVFRSDDEGRHWSAVGTPVPERAVVPRAVAVVDHVILMATDRGVYRSADDGQRWALSTENLPAHLETGFLVGDPRDPATVYAGFALTPYEELSRRAAVGGGALGRLDLVNLAGGLAFLALLLVTAGVLVWRLARIYYAAAGPAPR